MSLSRRDFALLADFVKRVDPRTLPNFNAGDAHYKGMLRQYSVTLEVLGDFCRAYNPHFDRAAWIRPLEKGPSA